MTFLQYVWQYVIPGVLLIGLGFFAGTHPNAIFGFVGFLSFFTVGVALILEGRKKWQACRK